MDQQTAQTANTPAAPMVRKLAPVGELLSQAWKIFSSKIWRFFEFSFAQLGLYILIFAIVVFGFIFYKMIGGNLGWISAYIIAGGAAILYCIYVGLRLGISQIYVAVYDKQHFKEYFALSKGKVAQFFWIEILAGLAVLGGMFLLIIPGIIMAISLTFVAWVYLLEDRRGMAALQQSRKYAKGRLAGILGRGFLAGLIVGVISGAVQFIFADYKAVSTVLGAVINLLTTGFTISFGYLLYKSAAETADPDVKIKTWRPAALITISIVSIAIILAAVIYGIITH